MKFHVTLYPRFTIIYCSSLILSGILFSLSLSGQTYDTYKKIDKHSAGSPKSVSRDLDRLVEYLVKPASSDREKVRAFYTWINRNIKYDKKGLDNDNLSYNYDPLEILQNRKAICTGFSRLFKSMCNRADIPAEVISGYSKGILTSRSELNAPDHAWNSVYADGQWHLLDVTWGTGLSHHKTRSNGTGPNRYFLSSPEEFILDHLPALPCWQLLSNPITAEDFMTNRMSGGHGIITDPLYAFEDSIAKYLQLSGPERRLYRNHQTFLFLPSKKNKVQYGYALVDYASYLSDSLKLLDPEMFMDSILILQKEIIEHCREARKYCTFHNWQSELEIENLINHAVTLYQKEIIKENPISTSWKEILSYLKDAMSVLSSTESTFYTDMARQQCGQYISIISDLVSRNEQEPDRQD